MRPTIDVSRGSLGHPIMKNIISLVPRVQLRGNWMRVFYSNEAWAMNDIRIRLPVTTCDYVSFKILCHHFFVFACHRRRRQMSVRQPNISGDETKRMQ